MRSLEFLEHEQILVAGDEQLAAARQRGGENAIVGPVAADRWQRKGGLDQRGLPTHEVREQARMAGREAELEPQLVLQLAEHLWGSEDLAATARGPPPRRHWPSVVRTASQTLVSSRIRTRQGEDFLFSQTGRPGQSVEGGQQLVQLALIREQPVQQARRLRRRETADFLNHFSSSHAGKVNRFNPGARGNSGEVVATIYKSLGLDLDTHLPGPQGRPFALVDFGVREVKELF